MGSLGLACRVPGYIIWYTWSTLHVQTRTLLSYIINLKRVEQINA